MKKHADLVYISAPHLIPVTKSTETENAEDKDNNPQVGKNDEQRGWYFSTPELTFNSHDKTEFCHGLQDSLDIVKRAFEELGPFDGILGFSQGAALASILCDLLSKGGIFKIILHILLMKIHHQFSLSLIYFLELSFHFKFAILVSGFQSKLSPHSHFYETKKVIPSLHVIGDTDRIVEKGSF